MRVTQGMLSNQVLFDLENNYQRLSQYQNEAATGNKINKPSDDPIGVQFVMQYKSESSQYTHYEQNATQATSQLSYTSTVMNEAQNVMQRARDLAVQGSNGTMTQSDMQTLATEVGQLSSQMITIGNSQYNGAYIFNGQNTAKPPYTDPTIDSSANPALVTTDSGSTLYNLGSGVTLAVNATGNQFFGDAGKSDNTFKILSDLKSDLNSGNKTAVGDLISSFDSAMSKMSNVQADIGARQDRAQLMQNRMTDLSQNVTQLLSATQGADMAKVLTNLDTAMTVQQASLKVGAEAIVPTLVDFLK